MYIIKKLLIIVFLITLSACAKPKASSHLFNLSADAAQDHPELIKNTQRVIADLKRNAKGIHVYPKTEPLIMSEVNSYANKTNLSQEARDKNMEDLFKEHTRKKQVFVFDIYASNPNSISTSSWTVKAIDHMGVEYPLSFDKTYTDKSTSMQSNTTPGYFRNNMYFPGSTTTTNITTYHLSGLLVSKKPIDLTRKFSLAFLQQGENPVILEWSEPKI